jgi:hypothetical protein
MGYFILLKNSKDGASITVIVKKYLLQFVKVAISTTSRQKAESNRPSYYIKNIVH